MKNRHNLFKKFLQIRLALRYLNIAKVAFGTFFNSSCIYF